MQPLTRKSCVSPDARASLWLVAVAMQLTRSGLAASSRQLTRPHVVRKVSDVRPVLPRTCAQSPPLQLHRHGVNVVVRSAGPQAPEASGAPEGQISSTLIESMRQKIGEALETDQVSIQDVYGDGRHVSIDVVSSAFEGKNSVARQRLVYKVRT